MFKKFAVLKENRVAKLVAVAVLTVAIAAGFIVGGILTSRDMTAEAGASGMLTSFNGENVLPPEYAPVNVTGVPIIDENGELVTGVDIAAFDFHIFADHFASGAHTCGNIAVNELGGTVAGISGAPEFGSRQNHDVDSVKLSYIGTTSGWSSSATADYFVFGSECSIGGRTGGQVFLESQGKSHMMGNDNNGSLTGKVYIDENDNFIDIDKELEEAEGYQRYLVKLMEEDKEGDNVRVLDYDDVAATMGFFGPMGRNIDFKKYPEDTIIINLSGSSYWGWMEMKNVTQFINGNITMHGTAGKRIIFNVDMSGLGDDVKFWDTQMKADRISNSEDAALMDNNILWNFYVPNDQHYADSYEGQFSVGGTWVGTVLAPDATVLCKAGLNGSIIANEVATTAETHKSDYTGERAIDDNTSLTVTKNWQDNPLTRPAFITIQLYQNNKLYKTVQMTGDSGNVWTYTFTDLPATDKPGNTFQYEIKEVVPEGYTGSQMNYTLYNVSEGGYVPATPVQYNLEVTKFDNDGNKLEGATLVLTSDDGNNLSGAECSAQGAQKTDKEIVWTSTKNTVTISNLPAGNYTITERKAPAGYVASAPIKISVTEANSSKQTTETTDLITHKFTADVVNTPIVVKLAKVTPYGDALPGASMKLTANGGQDLSQVDGGNYENGAITWTSGSQPITLSMLPEGSYTLTETDAPDGYEIAAPITFNVTKDGKVHYNNSNNNTPDTVTMIDNIKVVPPDPIFYKISVTKVEDKIVDGNVTTVPLKGAEFTLSHIGGESLEEVVGGTYDKDTNTVTWTSTEDAMVLSNLPAGAYTLTETNAPAGYLPAAPVSFSLSGNAAAVNAYDFTCIIKNEKIKVNISKKDAVSGAELTGAKLQLTANNGQSLAKVYGAGVTYNAAKGETAENLTWTSNGTPISLEGLPVGTYTLTETEAPAGYREATEVTFTVDAYGKINGGDTATMYDAPNETSIGKQYYDASKQGNDAYGTLPGAKLQLSANDDQNLANVSGSINVSYDKDANTVTWTSGTAANVLRGLPNGSYTLTELSAPEGFEPATPITFTVTDGAVTLPEGSTGELDDGTLLMTDDKVVYWSVNIAKSAIDGTALPGAKLAIFDAAAYDAGKTAETDAIFVYTSTEQPEDIFLDNGEYVLVELSAPEGYYKSEEKIYFTVDDGNIEVDETVGAVAPENLTFTTTLDFDAADAAFTESFDLTELVAKYGMPIKVDYKLDSPVTEPVEEEEEPVDYTGWVITKTGSVGYSKTAYGTLTNTTAAAGTIYDVPENLYISSANGTFSSAAIYIGKTELDSNNTAAIYRNNSIEGNNTAPIPNTAGSLTELVAGTTYYITAEAQGNNFSDAVISITEPSGNQGGGSDGDLNGWEFNILINGEKTDGNFTSSEFVLKKGTKDILPPEGLSFTSNKAITIDKVYLSINNNAIYINEESCSYELNESNNYTVTIPWTGTGWNNDESAQFTHFRTTGNYELKGFIYFSTLDGTSSDTVTLGAGFVGQAEPANISLNGNITAVGSDSAAKSSASTANNLVLGQQSVSDELTYTNTSYTYAEGDKVTFTLTQTHEPIAQVKDVDVTFYFDPANYKPTTVTKPAGGNGPQQLALSNRQIPSENRPQCAVSLTKVDDNNTAIGDNPAGFMLYNANGKLVKVIKTSTGNYTWSDMGDFRVDASEIKATSDPANTVTVKLTDYCKNNDGLPDSIGFVLGSFTEENGISFSAVIENKTQGTSVTLDTVTPDSTNVLWEAVDLSALKYAEGDEIELVITENYTNNPQSVEIFLYNTLYTDNSGVLNITGLDEGDYMLIETVLPDNYTYADGEDGVPKTYVEFTLTQNNNTAAIGNGIISHRNTLKTGEITVVKNDDMGRAKPGTVFRLYSVKNSGPITVAQTGSATDGAYSYNLSESTTHTTDLVTDNAGKVVVSGLPFDDLYYVMEVTPPAGALNDHADKQLPLNYDSTNGKGGYQLYFDNTNNNTDDGVWYDYGVLLSENAVIRNITPAETEGGADVIGKSATQAVESGLVSVTNTTFTTNISKVNESKEEIAGAVLELRPQTMGSTAILNTVTASLDTDYVVEYTYKTDANGEYVFDENGALIITGIADEYLTWTSGIVKDETDGDANGEAAVPVPNVLRGLPAGTYILTEVDAPTGYDIANAITFTVGTDGKITNVIGSESVRPDDYTVTMTDKPLTGSVTLTKHDSTTLSRLTGASFNLYDSNNQLVNVTGANGVYAYAASAADGTTKVLETNNSTAVPADTGKLTVTGLPLGSYYFKEVTSPDGYLISDEEVEFTVADGENKTLDAAVQALNEKIPTTSVTINKVWADNNNQDGKRPASITVQLYAGSTAEGAAVTLSGEGNEWTYTWNDLPTKKADGTAITYTVAEVVDGAAVANGSTVTYNGAAYTVTQDGFTITNTHTPEKIAAINVTKQWDDSNNSAGFRPTSVTVELYKNGNPTGKTIELTNSNWSGKFENLDKYENGEEIQYTVVETGEKGVYTSQTTGSIADGFIIKNSYTPGTTSVTVNKIWDDSGNANVKHPNITFNLIKNGTEPAVESYTITDGATSYTFQNLPKYENGAEIVYTVTESPVVGYTTSVTGNAANGYYFTNTPISVTVEKVDQDNNDLSGARLMLTANNGQSLANAYGAGVTYNAAEGETAENLKWTSTGSDVIIYGLPAGAYTLTEVQAPTGYTQADLVEFNIVVAADGTVTYTDDEGAPITKVTMIDQIITGKIVLSKIDSADDAPLTGAQFTFAGKDATSGNYNAVGLTGANGVYSYDASKNGTAITLDTDEHGQIVITGLPINSIKNYSFTETLAPSGYLLVTAPVYVTFEGVTTTTAEAVVSVNAENTEIAAAATTVTKTWVDGNNADSKRPESINVWILNGSGAKVKEVTLSADDGWTKQINDLAATDTNGTPITYTAVEVVNGEPVVNGSNIAYGDAVYTVTQSGMNITNTLLGNITVEKVWLGGNAETRPAVQAQLYKGTVAEGDAVTLNAGNSWTYTWPDLPMYNADGTPVDYSVRELGEVQGYIKLQSTANSDNGWKLINTATTAINVTKTWDDNNDTDRRRPSEVYIQLGTTATVNETLVFTPVAEAEVIELEAGTNVATANGQWTGLPLYNADGTLVNYAVREVVLNETDGSYVAGAPNGYIPEVTGDVANGFTVTNKYTPETVNINVTKTWLDGGSENRPDEVVVTLYENGTATQKTLTLTSEGRWTDSFTNLPKNKDGQPIEYTVVETTPAGYSSKVTGTAATGFTLTNTKVTNIVVEKVWRDSSTDNRAPIIVKILANDVDMNDNRTITVDTEWKATWNNLPMYDSSNNLITYTVEESAIGAAGSNYITVQGVAAAENGWKIINVESIDINVEKIWNDRNDRETIRPASAFIQLCIDNTVEGADTPDFVPVVGKTPVEITADRLTGSWTNLPAYTADGTAIKYVVREVLKQEDGTYVAGVPDGYTAEVTGSIENGFTVTNSHSSEDISITVKKEWSDAENPALRPDTVTVQLKANMENSGDPIELNETNGWTYTWSDLVKSSAGQDIDYTVVELNVKNYTAETVKEGNTVTITNTLNAPSVNISKKEIVNGPEIPGATLKITLETAASGVTLEGIDSLLEVDFNEAKTEITWRSVATTPNKIWSMPAGTYILTETIAPNGYELSEETIRFKINDDNTVSVYNNETHSFEDVADKGIVMINEPSSLKVSKKEIVNGPEIAEAELEIKPVTAGLKIDDVVVPTGVTKDTETNTITWKSNPENPTEIGVLPAGDYTLTETTAPDGYEIAEVIQFKVNADHTISVLNSTTGEYEEVTDETIVMLDAPSPLKVSKKEIANGPEIAEAELEIKPVTAGLKIDDVVVPTGVTKDTETNTITWKSNPDNPTEIGVLPAGDYTLTETTAPDGYKVAEVIRFTVHENHTISVLNPTTGEYVKANDETVVMLDAPITAKFSKQEVGGSPEIADAHLEIKPVTAGLKIDNVAVPEGVTKDPAKNIITWVSGGTAKEIGRLPIGDYTLTETTAPDGYEVAEVLRFRINADYTVSVLNSETGEYVVAGDGTVIMFDAPSPLKISKQEVGGGPEIVDAVLKIEPNDDDISLEDVEVPEGVELDTDKNIISWKSGGAPKEIGILPAGEYTLTEITAPAGYEVAEEMIFRVNPDHTIEYYDAEAKEFKVVEDETVVMFDAPAPAVFSKQIKGGTGSELAKAELEIMPTTTGVKIDDVVVPKGVTKDTKNNVISWTSGSAPIEISGLEPGDYVFTETTAPAGYEIAEQIKFRVTETHAVLVFDKASNNYVPVNKNTVVMYDAATPEQVKAGFSFTKRSDTGKTLPGAEFELKGEGYNKTVKSNENGLVTFGDIPTGTYTLTEKAAPIGYNKSTSVITVVVDAKGAVSFKAANGTALDSDGVEKAMINTEKDSGGTTTTTTTTTTTRTTTTTTKNNSFYVQGDGNSNNPNTGDQAQARIQVAIIGLECSIAAMLICAVIFIRRRRQKTENK